MPSFPDLALGRPYADMPPDSKNKWTKKGASLHASVSRFRLSSANALCKNPLAPQQPTRLFEVKLVVDQIGPQPTQLLVGKSAVNQPIVELVSTTST